MKHLLPPLPYDYAALEPHIDARTMMLHHDKHHASYVENLNAALEKYPELHERTAIWLLLNLSQVPAAARTAVHHNAGGHVNHSLLWRAMSPPGRRARGSACRCDQSRFWQPGAVQGPLRRSGQQAIRIRVGLARASAAGRGRVEGVCHIRSRQSPDARPLPAAGQRCLGACLLPET